MKKETSLPAAENATCEKKSFSTLDKPSAPDMAEELAKLRPLVGELNAAIGIRDKQLDTLRADKAELVEACKFAHRYHVMQEQKETGHDFPPQLANTLSALLSKHSTQGSK